MVDSGFFIGAVVDRNVDEIALRAGLENFCVDAGPRTTAIANAFDHLFVAILESEGVFYCNLYLLILISEARAVPVVISNNERK